ncbi:MAG: NAD(P)H-hydrate dehydratase [Clostridia bacterium]
MRKVLTPEQMRAVEARYMADSGTASLELMERAAVQVARQVLLLVGGPGKIAAFACGRGGNGGDGYAAARLYANAGGRALVLSALGESELSADARVNCARARATQGVAFIAEDALERLPVPAAWVDALFGIGLARAPGAAVARVIARMARDRAQGAQVVSVDIASGLDALTGGAPGACVCATQTIAFECAKPGHLLGFGPQMSGQLTVAPLGIPESFLPADALLAPSVQDAREALVPRPRLSHKGDYGHLLVVAGCSGMAGAALLATGAALRSGTGLVTVACPASIAPILQACQPCAMCVALPESAGAISAAAVPVLEAALAGKTALAVGPGLSRGCAPELIACCLKSELRAVFDADALNLIAAHPALRALLCARHLITPHPGEAARLLGRPMTAPLCDAQALHALGPVAILKGATSLVVGDATYVSTTGCAGLAKGGSGDVLTGMAGALLAQGCPPERAAWVAQVLHGTLGEITARHVGERAMTAHDLLAHLGKAWGDVD